MKIRTVTIDFWGTLLWDLPASDERYKRVRLDGFQSILTAAGVAVGRPALERAYEASRGFLARIWAGQRDVSADEHVRAILTAADPALVQRVPDATLGALVDAYARPALMVPPTVDPGARGALPALRARGLTLAVVSNTMRTPGATLRRRVHQPEGRGHRRRVDEPPSRWVRPRPAARQRRGVPRGRFHGRAGRHGRHVRPAGDRAGGPGVRGRRLRVDVGRVRLTRRRPRRRRRSGRRGGPRCQAAGADA